MICACQPLKRDARRENGMGPLRSISLNRNPVVIDLDLDTLGLLPVLIDQITQNHDGHTENRADGVELVTAHRVINA